MESTGKNITFDEMPFLIAKLLDRFDALSAQIQAKTSSNPLSEWMDIDELRDYLPGHVARCTVYDWIKNDGFPHYKNGKALYFLRSEIDDWLKSKGDRK